MGTLTRSDIVNMLAEKFADKDLLKSDISLSVRELLQAMSTGLAKGERIEIRGFGSFTLRERKPRIGRNPKTGDPVALGVKYTPHFKAGKDLREKVQAALEAELAAGKIIE